MSDYGIKLEYCGPDFKDDRTPEQKYTHYLLWIGTDTFMSGWRCRNGRPSYAAWACKVEDVSACEAWINSRKDMKRVRFHNEKWSGRYRPRRDVDVHIYVYDGQGRALA